MGWTHETYACGELGHQGEDLLNCFLVIPLYKNSAGTAIRPMAVPQVLRQGSHFTTPAGFD